MSILEELENSIIRQPIIMVSGVQGAGKTQFCSEAPDNLWFPLENGLGAKVLSNVVPEKYCKKYREFINFLKKIRDDETIRTSFKCLTINSMTALYRLIEDDIFDMAQSASKNNLRPTSVNSPFHDMLNFNKGEKNEVPNRFDEVMRLLCEIRDRHNLRIHIISHTNLTKSKNNVFDGLDTYTIAPDLRNTNAINSVLGLCDFNIVIDDLIEKQNLDKAGIKKLIKSKTKVLRINDPRCSCKARAGYLNYDIIDEEDNIKNKEGDLLSIQELPIQEKNGYAIFDYLLIKDIQILNKKNDNKKNEEK